MRYVVLVHQWIQHLSLRQKIILGAALAFFIVSSSVLVWWLLTPSYGVLFQDLAAEDAQRMVKQLEQEQISYQLRHGSRDILIDKPLIASTRLKIMGSNLQFNGQVGFELFDKSDFGMTDFSQKINFQRALQGELERTIASFAEVRQARVHLVIPEHHLFSADQEQPKAAVTLHLKSPLTRRQVNSIQHLVAASVTHLAQQQVIVMDQNGNTLSANADEEPKNAQLKTKKMIEHYLSDKVMHVLQPLFPPQQVFVNIDATLNYDEVEREIIKTP